jgi:Uma2 family endonuclease
MSQATPLAPEAISLSASDLEKFYEIVDGQRVDKMPVGTFPTLVVSILSQKLGHHARANGLGRVVFHMLFDLNLESRTMRRPNVAFASYERWPRGRKVDSKESIDVIPDLAIEVIRSRDTACELLRKIKDYFEAGVLRVWVVYPADRLVYIYESPKKVTILGEGDDLDGGDLLPGFKLSLAELFEDGVEV